MPGGPVDPTTSIDESHLPQIIEQTMRGRTTDQVVDEAFSRLHTP